MSPPSSFVSKTTAMLSELLRRGLSRRASDVGSGWPPSLPAHSELFGLSRLPFSALLPTLAAALAAVMITEPA